MINLRDDLVHPGVPLRRLLLMLRRADRLVGTVGYCPSDVPMNIAMGKTSALQLDIGQSRKRVILDVCGIAVGTKDQELGKPDYKPIDLSK